METNWLALGLMFLFIGAGLSAIPFNQWLDTRRDAKRRNQARPWKGRLR